MTPSKQQAGPDPRLVRLLGGEELTELRRRLRSHFERTNESVSVRSIQLARLTKSEQDALALLTGQPVRSTSSRRIDLNSVDAALLAAGVARSLRHALEILEGPIVHRATERALRRAQWSAVTTKVDHHPVLSRWLQVPNAAGLLKRLSKQDAAAADQFVRGAHEVLLRLPAAGLTRAQLAAEIFGNAHALDKGQPTATVVLAALRHHDMMQRASAESHIESDSDDSAIDTQVEERARDLWAKSGVLVNELARPALFLNLPVQPGDAPLSPQGEPGYLSLRRLLRTSINWSVDGQRIFVCENPNVVSIAADQLGVDCAPLVCTDGMPAAAQRVLLTQLAKAGAHLVYHGDFDWAGLHIANHVIKTHCASPWRFECSDYLQAVGEGVHATHDLKDSAVAASWDPSLTAAMQRRGIAIAEEAVMAGLLTDLTPA